MGKVKQILTLVLSIALAYFPLTFFLLPTKWDNLSAYFPYKKIACLWWNNGHIPFWNPYQNLGYPIHGDPQSFVWYPITTLLGFFGDYSLYALNMDTVLHITLGGLGVFYLFKHYKICSQTALITAFLFSISGFVQGTSNMIGFTGGVAWLPWCLLSLDKLLKTPNMRQSFLVAITYWLHITGAYPAFSIVLFYISIVYVIVFLLKNKGSLFEIQKFKYLLMTVMMWALLCAPYILSVFDTWQYATRSVALAYTPEHFAGNLNLLGLLSYILPYGIMSKNGFDGSFLSLTILYVGIIPFIIGLYALIKNWKRLPLLLGFYLVSLLLAMGYHTFLHKWFYLVLPGFKLFRHPYLFSLYSTLIILFSFARQWDTMKDTFTRKLIYQWLGTLGVLYLLFIVVIALTNFPSSKQIDEFSFFITHIREYSTFSLTQQAAVQCIALLLITLIFLAISLTKKFLPQRLFLLYIITEAAVVHTLLMPCNVVYNIPFENVNKHLKILHKPALTNQTIETPLIELSNDSIASTPGLWTNLNSYTRTTGQDGYNPYKMAHFYRLLKSDSFDIINKKGILYADGGAELGDFKIGFNQFTTKVHLKTQSDTVHLSQMYHHRWKCYLNDKSIPILKAPFGTMSVIVPESGNICFKYENKSIAYAFYAQSLIILLMVILLLGQRTKKIEFG